MCKRAPVESASGIKRRRQTAAQAEERVERRLCGLTLLCIFRFIIDRGVEERDSHGPGWKSLVGCFDCKQLSAMSHVL